MSGNKARLTIGTNGVLVLSRWSSQEVTQQCPYSLKTRSWSLASEPSHAPVPEGQKDLFLPEGLQEVSMEQISGFSASCRAGQTRLLGLPGAIT